MDYIAIAVLGCLGGGFCVFIALDKQRKRVEQLTRKQAADAEFLKTARNEINAKKEEIDQYAVRVQAELETRQQQIVSYKELHDENVLLKRDLRNLGINVRKLQLDRELQQQSQQVIDQKVQELGSRYLKENVKSIGNAINQNNFASCKQRLRDVIQRCREIGLEIAPDEEAAYLADLRTEYERVVRAAFEREEQARIKAQIREEQQREREIQREQAKIERERAVLQEALARALAMTQDQHSAEIEGLRARLEEAEAKQRAISQAQLTKAGFVYVISNIGSFGEGVFKIGMTRRLEPSERVRELGDASVPFPFDVHMMISCEDAPALENALHGKLLKQQVNRTNPRKEFFKTDIESIVEVVREHHGEVQYVADAEALEYRQSLTMSDEDQEFIEHVFDELEGEDETFGDDPSRPVLSAE